MKLIFCQFYCSLTSFLWVKLLEGKSPMSYRAKARKGTFDSV